MEFKIKTSEIKPNRHSSPSFSTISRKERWLQAAQAIAQLLELYLGDADLIFTDNDFSSIWTIGQFGHSDFEGIITQFRLISSLELWKEFPEFVEFLFTECKLQSRTRALFRSLYKLHSKLPEPVRQKIPLLSVEKPQAASVKISANPKISEPFSNPKLESAKTIDGVKLTSLQSMAISSEPVVIS